MSDTTSLSITRTAPDSGAAAGITITGWQNPTAQAAQKGDAPLIIALHGGGMSAKYFDVPGHSLLERADARNVPAISLNRPNNGGSSLLSSDHIIAENAAILDQVIAGIWAEWSDKVPGIFLIGHSIGGAITTDIAGNHPTWPLLGIATSGCLLTTNPGGDLPPIELLELPLDASDGGMFGPAGTYGDDMPAVSHVANSTVPVAELKEIGTTWTARVREVAANVVVPVFHRQAEFDALWVTTDETVAEYRAAFTASPKVDVELLHATAHAIDFHLVGAKFQDDQLDFAAAAAR